MHDLSFDLERGEKLVVVGQNGAGKSTLLRILAGKDSSYSGKVEPGAGVVSAGFFADEQAAATAAHTVEEEIGIVCPTALFPKIRSMLGAFLFRGDEIYKSVSVLSGGEKSRLALLKILLYPANLLILDEPTNHLDLGSKDVLLDALKKFEGTVVFVSHDRYFIQGLATRVLELRAGLPARFFPGNYEYYLHRINEEEKAVSAALPGRPNLPEKVILPPAAGDSREEQKQRKTRLRRLQRCEEQILAGIADLEERCALIQKDMALPEVYADGLKMKSLKEELTAGEKEIKRLHDEWEQTVKQIEAFQEI